MIDTQDKKDLLPERKTLNFDDTSRREIEVLWPKVKGKHTTGGATTLHSFLLNLIVRGAKDLRRELESSQTAA